MASLTSYHECADIDDDFEESPGCLPVILIAGVSLGLLIVMLVW